MITIFGTPRAFRDHFGLIQRNAIGSWLQLRPRPQILLMGNEEGVREVCAELGVTHVPDIECNEFGTPLVSSMISRAEALSLHRCMLLVSTDIVLFDDTMEAARITLQRFDRFCAVACRKDIDLREPIAFDDPHWEQGIRGAIDPHQPDKVAFGDYFLFSKGLWGEFPPFATGRTQVDNWMFYRTLALGAALVNLTPCVTIIHQNHDHSHHPQGLHGVYHGVEAQRNLALAGGLQHFFFISDANWILTPAGFQRPRLTPRYLRRYLSTFSALHPRLGAPYRLARAVRRGSRRLEYALAQKVRA